MAVVSQGSASLATIVHFLRCIHLGKGSKAEASPQFTHSFLPILEHNLP